MNTRFTFHPSIYMLCAGYLLAGPVNALATTTTTQQNLTYSPTIHTAQQSGPISQFDTFGAVIQDGDVLNAGPYSITIDNSFSAGSIEAPQDYAVLTGEFIVAAGVTLTVYGDWNAAQSTTQNQLKQGSHVEFDGLVGINRAYTTVAQHYTAPSLVIASTVQDKAFFGLKPGSLATFKYDKRGFLGANISGGNVHLNGFSTGYTHDGYNRPTTNTCEMPNVLLTNSGQFELGYFAGMNGSCDMRNLTILGPLPHVYSAFRTVGSYADSAQDSKFNLNGLSVDGRVEFYSRPEFTMNNWVLKDLEATSPLHGWQDINGWLLFNADSLPVGAVNMANIYFRDEKYNPHGFSFSTPGPQGTVTRNIDSAVFDFVNLDGGESGDIYLMSGAGATNETVRITNNVALANINGQQSSTFVTFNSSNQNGRKLELENNVVYIPLTNRAVALNEASSTPVNSLTSVKNNIFWGDINQKGYIIGSLSSASTEDILSAGVYANNSAYNARTDGTYGPLDLPLSYIPNISVTTDNPRFNDDTRRLETYAEKVLNLPEPSAEKAFLAHVTSHLSAKDISQLTLLGDHQKYVTNHKGELSIEALVDWVKQGFIPTTTTYHTTNIGLNEVPTFTLADTDGDTVDDRFDHCAATANNEVIDEHGCSINQLDEDGDLVSNDVDICFNTTVNTLVDVHGCSLAQIKGEIAGFSSWGIGGGGAMAGYAINPFNDDMRFVGTDMGTLFRSLNKGVNWAPVNHTQTTFSSQLGYASAPGFAGTKTVVHAPQGLNPVRSIDGGQTFSSMTNLVLNANNNERITGWYSDTVNTGIVYAMSSQGLWRSADSASQWSFVFGGGDIKGMFIDNQEAGKVYIATEDHILTATDGINFTIDHTVSNHKIYAFTGGSSATGKTIAYASDESALAISIAQTAGLQATDVVATYDKPSSAGTTPSAGMIYVKKDNANDFSQTNQFIGSFLHMAQNDENTIYATGARSWKRAKGTSVYLSTDAGTSWHLKLLQYDLDLPTYIPWSPTLMEHSPVGLNIGWYDGGYHTTNINQLDSTQFGGSGNFFLFGTDSHGDFWQDLANEYEGSTPNAPLASDKWSTGGLNVTSVYDIKFNPANPSDIYVANADIHGSRSTDGGLSWNILPSSQNSIYDYAFDPSDANTVFMVNGSNHDWPFRELTVDGAGGVFKSTNKGDTWQRLTPKNSDYQRQFLSIGYDATRNHIYAGSHKDGISRSLDGGVTWQKFNTGLPSTLEGHSYGLDLVIPQIKVLPNGNVYALVTGVRPELTAQQVIDLALTDNEVMTDTSGSTTHYYSWINHKVTGIYLLDVAGGKTSWSHLRDNINLVSHGSWNNDHLPWMRPMSFAVDANNPSTLWLTDMEPGTFQSGASGIWKSMDSGVNWTFELQHTSPLDIDIDPSNANHVIVAGPQTWNNGGIHITKDGGDNWTMDARPPLQDNAHSVSFVPGQTSKIVYGYFGGGMLFGDKY